jgi:hypothetical protein
MIIYIWQKLIHTFCSVFKVPTPAISCWRLPLIHFQKQAPKTNHIIRHKSGPRIALAAPRAIDITLDTYLFTFKNLNRLNQQVQSFPVDGYTAYLLTEWR